MKLVLVFIVIVVLLGLWIFILIKSNKKLQDKYESEKAKASKIEADYLRYKSERELWDAKKKQAEKNKKDLHTGTDTDRFNAADAVLRNNSN